MNIEYTIVLLLLLLLLLVFSTRIGIVIEFPNTVLHKSHFTREDELGRHEKGDRGKA